MRNPRGLPASTEAILRHWREAVPDDRLAHLVRDAARGLARALQMRLAAHGVPFGHWIFLRILWEQDGLTQRELAERSGLTEPTTFTALSAMERLGYVVRERRPDGRHRRAVFLTPKGRALKDRLVPLAEEVNRIAIAGAADPEIAAVRALLLRMIGNLAADELDTGRRGPDACARRRKD